MALIDVVKWEAGADELVWKFPNSELSTMTQLIVRESQSALLFKNGQAFDVFRSGRYTLSTNNIPILNKLVNLPFGGQSPFSAEVYFVNHAIPLDLKWGTPTPIQLEDPQYGLVVPVSAFGQMGVQVRDPGKFVLALVGTMRSFTARTVLEYFKGVLVSQLKASIAQAIVKRQIPVLQIETELITLSEDIQRDIAPHFERFGLDVHLFRIMSISVPENDPSVYELKKAKAAAARRKIEGTNYQQERSFDAMQAAVGHPSGMGGMMAQMGAGMAVGGVMGQMAGAAMHGVRAPGAGPNPDLLRFIDAIVADGQFTAKKREVLRRKANECGMDPDEAEILADAKLHELLHNRPPPSVNAPPPFPSTGGPPPFGGFGAAPTYSYHVRFHGQQIGPVPFEQMKQAHAQGQLTAQTPVWRDGLTCWGPASAVPELAAMFAPPMSGPPYFGVPPSSEGGPPPSGAGYAQTPASGGYGPPPGSGGYGPPWGGGGP